MGAQKSVHAGKAKVDFKVDLTHKLCAAFMLTPFRDSGSPLSLVIGSLCVNHPNLFGGREKLDFFWDKGLYDTNVVVEFKRPKAECISQQQSFVVQHSISPEIAIHGMPIENFSRSGSAGVNLCRLSMGLDLNDPASHNWRSKTSIRYEHVRPINDDGRPISRDLDGFLVTCSGNPHDHMVVLKQETKYTNASDNCFTRFNLQIEQGLPVLSKWLIFNRFKFVGTKGVKLGSCLLTTSFTGGSIVGDMAPYQAFAIGGQSSVRGYGEGAVGTGRSCFIANGDIAIPLFGINEQKWHILNVIFLLQTNSNNSGVFLHLLFCFQGEKAEGLLFMDYGSDMGSGRLVPGNPAQRLGKPGRGVGFGYGVRIKSPWGLIQVDYAFNDHQQRSVHFGIIKFT